MITSQVAFSHIKAGQYRTIKGSIFTRFDADTEDCLLGVVGVLCIMDIQLNNKSCQRLETEYSRCESKVPIFLEKSIVKKWVMYTLKLLEIKLITNDPHNFTKTHHYKLKCIDKKDNQNILKYLECLGRSLITKIPVGPTGTSYLYFELQRKIALELKPSWTKQKPGTSGKISLVRPHTRSKWC